MPEIHLHVAGTLSNQPTNKLFNNITVHVDKEQLSYWLSQNRCIRLDVVFGVSNISHISLFFT